MEIKALLLASPRPTGITDSPRLIQTSVHLKGAMWTILSNTQPEVVVRKEETPIANCMKQIVTLLRTVTPSLESGRICGSREPVE